MVLCWAAEAEEIWKLRHTISEAQKPEGASLKHDVSVPVAKIGEFIEQVEGRILAQCPNARMVAFGHVGDGNVHLNISQPVGMDSQQFLSERELVANIVYELAAEFEGSFSAEHGIGQARRGYLARYRSAVELDTMRAIKAALDPNGIMNPGKVL